jgi:hypothetical protein
MWERVEGGMGDVWQDVMDDLDHHPNADAD